MSYRLNAFLETAFGFCVVLFLAGFAGWIIGALMMAALHA